MTEEELDRMKYKVCCPMCYTYKCVRETEKCEAELWKKRRMRQMANELSVEDAIEVFEFMKREVLEGSKEDKVIDIAINALRYRPIILQEHDAEPRRLRAILDTATEEIYVRMLTKQSADVLGMTIEEADIDGK